jgi:hypothetical protein
MRHRPGWTRRENLDSRDIRETQVSRRARKYIVVPEAESLKPVSRSRWSRGTTVLRHIRVFGTLAVLRPARDLARLVRLPADRLAARRRGRSPEPRRMGTGDAAGARALAPYRRRGQDQFPVALRRDLRCPSDSPSPSRPRAGDVRHMQRRRRSSAKRSPVGRMGAAIADNLAETAVR